MYKRKKKMINFRYTNEIPDWENMENVHNLERE